ncbi:MAG: hypothetical protein GY697_23335 [Desulfobacterales bacterium]|nr:hypothetical protein [Desulfobacterales bacterium]
MYKVHLKVVLVQLWLGIIFSVLLVSPARAESLADFAGADVVLPESIDTAEVTLLADIGAIKTGQIRLNGVDATVALYTPADADGQPAEKPNLVLLHDTLHLVDYIPDLAGTAIDELGDYSQAAFVFVHVDNAGLLPADADAPALIAFRDDLDELELQPGINFLATANMADFNGGEQLAALMGMSGTELKLATTVPDTLFNNVHPGASPEPQLGADPGDRDITALRTLYGDELFSSLSFAVDADQFSGVIGPLTILSVQWELMLTLPQDLVDLSTLPVVLGLRSDISYSVAGATDVLQATDVLIEYDPHKRKFSLDGDLYSPTLSSDTLEPLLQVPQLPLMSEFRLALSGFNGELLHADNLSGNPTAGDIEHMHLALTGDGSLNNRAVDLEARLDWDADDLAFRPTLSVSTSLFLSDLLAENLPSLADPELTELVISRDYQSGQVQIDGAAVDVVRYRGVGDAYPVFGMKHAALDLGTYVPSIRGTTLGSFGLGEAVLYILPEDLPATVPQQLDYAGLCAIPEPLRAMLLDITEIEDIEENNRCDNPDEAANKAALEAMTIPGVFDLALRAGINVIGTYTPADDGAAAQSVMEAYGIDGAGYSLKANFKVSEIKQPDPGKPGISGVCGGVTRFEPTGLDLSFPLPGYAPPGIGNSVIFEDAQFALREINGQLEPSILTGMTFKLPVDVGSLQQVAMATKIALTGDASLLCDGVSAEDNIGLQFAGSSAFNLEQLNGIAFSALQEVISEPEIDDTNAEPQPITSCNLYEEGDIPQQEPDLGWQQAFGIPFLTVNQFASAGTFNHDQGNVSLDAALWSESLIGSETLEMYGALQTEAGDGTLNVASWQFRLPGPVNLGCLELPGLDQLPIISDITLRDIDLSDDEMTGTLEWDVNSNGRLSFSGINPDVRGSAWFEYAEVKNNAAFSLFASLSRFAVDMVWPRVMIAEGSLATAEQRLGPVLIGWRDKAPEISRLGDLAQPLQDMLLDAKPDFPLTGFGKFLDEDSPITLAQGLTVIGRTNIPEVVDLAPLPQLTPFIVVTDPDVLLTGAFNVSRASQDVEGETSLTIAELQLTGVPDTMVIFQNAKTQLGQAGSQGMLGFDSDALVNVPWPMPQGSSTLAMNGTTRVSIDERRNDVYDFSISLNSTDDWNQPFSIPATIAGISLEAELKHQPGLETLSLQACGVTTFDNNVPIPGNADIEGCAACTITNGDLSSCQPTAGDSVISLEFDPPLQLSDLVDAAGDFVGVAASQAGGGQQNPVPDWPSDVMQGSVSKLYLSQSTFAFDGAVDIAGFEVSGRFVVVDDNGQQALMARLDEAVSLPASDAQQITLADFLPAGLSGAYTLPPFAPLAATRIPEGVFIFSTQAVDSFSLEGIPATLFDELFEGLIDDPGQTRLEVADGVTFVTRARPDIFPPPARSILGGPLGLDMNREFLLGGSVGGLFGGEPSIAMYLELEGVTPDLPEHVRLFLEPRDSDLKLFVRSANSGAEVDVGLSSDAWLKARRLDNGELQVLQQQDGTQTPGLPTEFSLTYTLNGSNPTPELSVSAKVQGNWDTPLGLEGYSLINPEVAFGVTSTGTAVGIHVERAEFVDGNTSREFVLDLDTTWAGAVPTSLSGQFSRICPEAPEPCPDLELKPTLLAKMQKSFFDLAFSAGSNLSAQVEAQLPAEATAAFGAFRDAVGATGDGTLALLQNSPLSWIGLRNPSFYFGTPGSTPPKREGVERPPFGLGLKVAAELILDVGEIQADIADGLYGLDLKKGYYVSGTVTTPSEFGSNTFSLTGGQRLPSIPSLLELSGRLEFPGAILIPGVPAVAEGSFQFERTAVNSNDTTVNADISLAGGLISRAATFTVAGRQIYIESSPGGCLDVPVEIDGWIDLDGDIAKDIADSGSRFVFPTDPLDLLRCAQDGLAAAWNAALDNAEALANDPLAAQRAMADGARSVVDALPPGTPGKEELLAAINLGDDAFNSGSEFLIGAANEIPGFSTLNGVVGDGFGQATGLARQGFQVVNNIADGVVGLTGPVGEFLAGGVGTVTSVLTNLATETVTAIISGNPSAIGAAVARQLTSVTSSISCMFGCSSPPPTYKEHPQACADDQYWNPVFSNCFNRNAMVFMYTARDEADGLTRCLADVNGEARVQVCSGRDRQQFILDMQSQQIRTVPYGWNIFASRFYDEPQKCLTVIHEAGESWPREEFKDCGGEYAAQQRWTYTDQGKLINDASGQCLYWPGQRSHDTEDVVMVPCDSIAVPQGRLEWSGTAVTADYARSYLHPYQGALKMNGSCVNQGKYTINFGFSLVPIDYDIQVMELTSYEDSLAGNCQNWRFNYLDKQTVQLVLPERTYGTGLCLTYGNNIAGPSARVSSANCDATNKNQRFRVYHVNDNNSLGFYSQDAGKGLRERKFVLKQAPNAETGNNGSLCLTRDTSGELITRFTSCSQATSTNTFTFHPSDAALASVVADNKSRLADELLRQQMQVLTSGNLNGAFSGLEFAENDMCITGGANARSGDCYPFRLSLSESEHPDANVLRVYGRIQGQDYCMTATSDGRVNYQWCASGRSDQLWLREIFDADPSAFVLMNLQQQRCLQPQASTGQVPLILAECGDTRQVIRYRLPLMQGDGWEVPQISELQSGEEYQQARAAFTTGFSRSVTMQLQLGAESQYSPNRCVRLQRGNFFETLGDTVLLAGGCEKEFFGSYNEETSLRLWPTPEAALSGYRVHLDLDNTCLAIPDDADPDDASLNLLTESCETNKATQIWFRQSIAGSDAFRLCIEVQDNTDTTDFCLSSSYNKLLATPQDSSNATQALQLTGPWSIREESELVLAPEGGHGATGEQPPILPEFAYQAQFGDFAKYGDTDNAAQTDGYGIFVIDIDLDSNEKQYCLHASSDPLTYDGLEWSSSSVPAGLVLTQNENGVQVILEGKRYNAELQLCGSSVTDGTLSGTAVAIYQSERGSGKRIHWREQNLCLTKPDSGTGFAYFDRCIYGLLSQSWSTSDIADLTVAPDPEPHPSSGKGGLIFNLPYTNGLGIDHTTITIKPSFKQTTTTVVSELLMYYNPVPGSVLPGDQDDDILARGYSSAHAVQLKLGTAPNQRCLAIDETAAADRKLVVQQCQSSSDDELLANNAFTRYQAEIPGGYRIRSEVTGECLTLPLFNDSNGRVAIELTEDPDAAAFCRESQEGSNDLFDLDRIILNRSSGERFPGELNSYAINLAAPFTRQQLCDEYKRVNFSYQNNEKVRSFCEDKLQDFDDIFQQSNGNKVSGRASREFIPATMMPFIPIDDSQPEHSRREICDFYSLDVPVLTSSCQVDHPGQIWSRQDDQFYIPILGENYCITEVPNQEITRPLARARKCQAPDVSYLRGAAPVVVKAADNLDPATGLAGAMSSRLLELTAALDALQQQFDDGAAQDTGDLEDRREALAALVTPLTGSAADILEAALVLNALVQTPGQLLAQALLIQSELDLLLAQRLAATNYLPALEAQIILLEDEIALLYQQSRDLGAASATLFDQALELKVRIAAEQALIASLVDELEQLRAELDALISKRDQVHQVINDNLDAPGLLNDSGNLGLALVTLEISVSDAITALRSISSHDYDPMPGNMELALQTITRVFNATGGSYASYDEVVLNQVLTDWSSALADADAAREWQLLYRQQLDNTDLQGNYSRMVFATPNECLRATQGATECASISLADSESGDASVRRVHMLGNSERIDSCLTLSADRQSARFERCSRDRMEQWWQTMPLNDGLFTLQVSAGGLCLQLDDSPDNQLKVAACGSAEQTLRLVPPIIDVAAAEIPDPQSGQDYVAFLNLVESGGSNSISIQLRLDEEGDNRCLASADPGNGAQLSIEDCADKLLVNYPESQSFRLLPATWEASGVYRLFMDSNTSCLDLSSPDGQQVNLETSDCQYGRSAQWWVRERVVVDGVQSPDTDEDGFFRLRSAGSLNELCLTVVGDRINSGPCGEPGQMMRVETAWKFYEEQGETSTDLQAPLSNTTPTGLVSITGNAIERQTLLAGNDLQDADGLGNISYQWQRNGRNISGAAQASYLLVQDDVDQQISVQARYYDGSGQLESISSSPTSAVINISHAPVGSVNILGTSARYERLTSEFDLQDSDGLGELFYQWQRNGVDIAGAIYKEYTVQPVDVGSRIRFVVEYEDGEGSLEQMMSAPTDTIMTDSDSVPDSIDNCPAIPNPDQADFDRDDIGDVCDPDRDNDGLPDVWERENGLDPYNSWDRNADPDGDGLDNTAEYEARSDPQKADTGSDEDGVPDSVGPNVFIVPIIQWLLLD